MATTAEIRHWEQYTVNGAPIVGANVYLREASLASPNVGAVAASTTTNADGMWEFTGLDDTKSWDVEVALGGVSRWYKGLSKAAIVIRPWNMEPQTNNTFYRGNGAGVAPTFAAITNTDLPNPITKDLKTSTDIVDANGNKIIGLGVTASAVAYVKLTNKDTGVNPIVEGAGEANTGLNLATNGTGKLQWNGADIWTAPTTWTPTLVQVGTATLTVNEARWFQIYKTVYVSCRCAVASGAGTTANPMLFGGLPVAQRAVVADKVLGNYIFIDASAGNTYYTGAVICGAGVNDCYCVVDLANTKLGNGFAFAAGDVFSLNLRYEIN